MMMYEGSSGGSDMSSISSSQQQILLTSNLEAEAALADIEVSTNNNIPDPQLFEEKLSQLVDYVTSLVGVASIESLLEKILSTLLNYIQKVAAPIWHSTHHHSTNTINNTNTDASSIIDQLSHLVLDDNITDNTLKTTHSTNVHVPEFWPSAILHHLYRMPLIKQHSTSFDESSQKQEPGSTIINDQLLFGKLRVDIIHALCCYSCLSYSEGDKQEQNIKWSMVKTHETIFNILSSLLKVDMEAGCPQNFISDVLDLIYDLVVCGWRPTTIDPLLDIIQSSMMKEMDHLDNGSIVESCLESIHVLSTKGYISQAEVYLLTKILCLLLASHNDEGNSSLEDDVCSRVKIGIGEEAHSLSAEIIWNLLAHRYTSIASVSALTKLLLEDQVSITICAMRAISAGMFGDMPHAEGIFSLRILWPQLLSAISEVATSIFVHISSSGAKRSWEHLDRYIDLLEETIVSITRLSDCLNHTQFDLTIDEWEYLHDSFANISNSSSYKLFNFEGNNELLNIIKAKVGFVQELLETLISSLDLDNAPASTMILILQLTKNNEKAADIVIAISKACLFAQDGPTIMKRMMDIVFQSEKVKSCNSENGYVVRYRFDAFVRTSAFEVLTEAVEINYPSSVASVSQNRSDMSYVSKGSYYSRSTWNSSFNMNNSVHPSIATATGALTSLWEVYEFHSFDVIIDLYVPKIFLEMKNYLVSQEFLDGSNNDSITYQDDASGLSSDGVSSSVLLGIQVLGEIYRSVRCPDELQKDIVTVLLNCVLDAHPLHSDIIDELCICIAHELQSNSTQILDFAVAALSRVSKAYVQGELDGMDKEKQEYALIVLLNLLKRIGYSPHLCFEYDNDCVIHAPLIDVHVENISSKKAGKIRPFLIKKMLDDLLILWENSPSSNIDRSIHSLVLEIFSNILIAGIPVPDSIVSSIILRKVTAPTLRFLKFVCGFNEDKYTSTKLRELVKNNLLHFQYNSLSLFTGNEMSDKLLETLCIFCENDCYSLDDLAICLGLILDASLIFRVQIDILQYEPKILEYLNSHEYSSTVYHRNLLKALVTSKNMVVDKPMMNYLELSKLSRLINLRGSFQSFSWLDRSNDLMVLTLRVGDGFSDIILRGPHEVCMHRIFHTFCFLDTCEEGRLGDDHNKSSRLSVDQWLEEIFSFGENIGKLKYLEDRQNEVKQKLQTFGLKNSSLENIAQLQPLGCGKHVERALSILDRAIPYQTHKIALFLMSPTIEGDTKRYSDPLTNSSTGSPLFVKFMTSLGSLVETKDLDFFSGGLDTSERYEDGKFTLLWMDNNPLMDTVILFHVVPLMPNGDQSTHLRKRHVGNDFVHIIFVDKEPNDLNRFSKRREVISHSDVSGAFGFVTIVVEPIFTAESTLVKISVRIKQGIDEYDMLSHLEDEMFIPLNDAASIIRQIAIRADFACQSQVMELRTGVKALKFDDRQSQINDMSRYIVKEE